MVVVARPSDCRDDGASLASPPADWDVIKPPSPGQYLKVVKKVCDWWRQNFPGNGNALETLPGIPAPDAEIGVGWYRQIECAGDVEPMKPRFIALRPANPEQIVRFYTFRQAGFYFEGLRNFRVLPYFPRRYESKPLRGPLEAP